MNKKVVLLFGIIVLVAVAFWVRNRKTGPTQSQTRYLMDTYCTITVPGPPEVLPAIEAAFARIEEIDRKFSALESDSPLYAFNRFNKPIVDEEIVSLVGRALRVSEQSAGAFDITVYPLVEAWGFYGDTPALPDNARIGRILPAVGYEHLAVEDGKLTKNGTHVQIDLGSIAKGYAVGEALRALKQKGIQSALIDAGGDIYALGTIHGKPWKIGIRNPRGEGNIGALELSDMAIVTSGDYERYFEREGIRYHHILDPRTGYPARGLASVTVISPDPTLADAWSTALFVMGREDGREAMEKVSGIETLMVTTGGEKFFTSGMNVTVQNK